MKIAEWILVGLAVSASLSWLAVLVRAIPYRKRPYLLADLPDEAPAGGWPALTVVLAARDEANQVEPAVRSLLAQDYPALQVIAVDDRSADATGAILDRLAREDERLQVVHVEQLPEGWLGKTHALELGRRAVQSEWTLFTDGDVHFRPAALRRAVSHAVQRELHHLTVIPDMPIEGVGERLFLTIFGLLFFLRFAPWDVENLRHRGHIGAGAFNLVRTAALTEAGGFEPIALSVDDDLRLGQLLKWTGHRAAVLLGLGAVSVRWHSGLGGLIRGVEKNFFAALDYRPAWTLFNFLAVLWTCAAPHAGLLIGPWWSRSLCAAGIAAIGVMLHSVGPRRQVGAHYALFLPLSAVLLDVAMLRSILATLRRGGVRWRDHLYPLDLLRRHVRERDRWMKDAWRRSRRAASGSPR